MFIIRGTINWLKGVLRPFALMKENSRSLIAFEVIFRILTFLVLFPIMTWMQRLWLIGNKTKVIAWYNAGTFIRNPISWIVFFVMVLMLKSDDMVPRLLEWNEWIMVDVISAATPVCPSDHYVSKTVIKNVFVPRIRNMMEAAISNEATTLIAGAFGCGPGGFPAEAVASAFLYLLRDEGYISEFNEIVFAIGTPDKKNISALYVFSQTFAGDWYKSTNDILKTQTISVDNNHNQMMYMMPTGKRLVGMQLDAFIHWRNENPYFGKKYPSWEMESVH